MEKKAKRTYTAEEKADAVALAEELGSGSAASQQLDIPESTLYGWLLKAEGGMQATESAQKKPRRPKSLESATSELEHLKEENKALKAERKADKLKFEELEKESKIKSDVIDFFVNRQKK